MLKNTSYLNGPEYDSPSGFTEFKSIMFYTILPKLKNLYFTQPPPTPKTLPHTHYNNLTQT